MTLWEGVVFILSYNVLIMSQQNPGYNPTAPSQAEAKNAFEMMAREGVFLLLENYMRENPWTREQAARDIWQNFFDANNFTTDGLHIHVEEHDGGSLVQLSGPSEFPYNRLLALGAGYKEDPTRSAGGKHEGAKVLALSLLRDYGCQEVRFGSGDWVVRFFLDEPVEGMVDEKMGEQRALYAQLLDAPERYKGSYISLVSNDEHLASEVVAARDLFYRKDHPDFEHPDIDTECGGLRVLPKGEFGNFYLNGQRVNVDRKGQWNTVPGLIAWTKMTPEAQGNKLALGRDRDMITSFEVSRIFPKFLVDSMTVDDAELLVDLLEPYYSPGSEMLAVLASRVLGEVIQKLAVAERKIAFPPMYFADDLPGMSPEQAELKKDRLQTIEGLGGRVCRGDFQRIGMKTVTEFFANIREIERLEPTEGERKRIALLENVVRDFLEGGFVHEERSASALIGHKDVSVRTMREFDRMPFRPIELFGSKHPYLAGKYEDGTVWISREQIHTQDVHTVLATYLHELCHTFGSDQSASFSYALTQMLGRWSRHVAEHAPQMQELATQWEASLTGSVWETRKDFEEALRQLLRERVVIRTEREMSQRMDRKSDAREEAEKICEMHRRYRIKEPLLAWFRSLYDEVHNEPVIRVLSAAPSETSPCSPEVIETLRRKMAELTVEESAWKDKWKGGRQQPAKLKPKDRMQKHALDQKREEVAALRVRVESGDMDRMLGLLREAKSLYLPKAGVTVNGLSLFTSEASLIALTEILMQSPMKLEEEPVLDTFLDDLQSRVRSEDSFRDAVVDALAMISVKLQKDSSPEFLEVAHKIYQLAL